MFYIEIKNKVLKFSSLTLLYLFPFIVLPTNAGILGDYPEAPSPFSTSYNEPNRGQFHFSPRSGWMNDINAPLYYRGVYHIFFQHAPQSLMHSQMHWGHATSTDLIHWQQENIALEPGVHDLQNLFSGSGWVDVDNVTELKVGNDDPILLFTNVDGVSIAYSTDGGKTFKLYNNGARVIDTFVTINGIRVPGVYSRDPKVQWDPEAQQWILALYKELNGTQGVRFYKSDNLLNWQATNEFNAPWFFECPDLFRLPIDGNENNYKWVLMDADGEYVIGSIDSNGNFTSDWGTTPQNMEMGITGFYNRGVQNSSAVTHWYASLTFNQLPDDRIVQMGWQPGNEGEQWTGNASFPVELSLKQYPEGIRITRNPISEIEDIRSSTFSWGAQTLPSNQNILSFLSDDAYEIEASFNLIGTSATYFGFNLGTNSQGGSATRSVTYDVNSKELNDIALTPINNKISIRLLVDRGQLEIFGNGGKVVITENVNFELSKRHLAFFSNGNVKLESLTFSRLDRIWSVKSAAKLGNSIYFQPSLSLPAPGSSPNNLQHQKCVDRDVASGKVQLWDCLRNKNQSWVMNTDGTIRNFDKCMEIPKYSTANGSLVRVNSCSGQSHQRWSSNSLGQLVNEASGKCLDLSYGLQDNGHQLQVWSCWSTNNPNQKWKGPSGTDAGRVQWELTNKCLRANTGNDEAVIWDCNEDNDQLWNLLPNGTLKAEGKCLTQRANELFNGATLIMDACSDADHQKWTRIDNGAYKNNASGRCIDLDIGNSTNGQQLQVWSCWSSYNKNQVWLGPF